MPKSHWLESYEVKEGLNLKEQITWKEYKYSDWKIEVSGTTNSLWDNAEATYDSPEGHSYHEVRGTYANLYDLLCCLEKAANLKRPEDPGCYHEGLTVKQSLRSFPLPPSIKSAVLGRLLMGEVKYGTKLTVGWDKALQYMEEEEDDMIAYCLSADKKLYTFILGWLIWLRRKLHKS